MTENIPSYPISYVIGVHPAPLPEPGQPDNNTYPYGESQIATFPGPDQPGVPVELVGLGLLILVVGAIIAGVLIKRNRTGEN